MEDYDNFRANLNYTRRFASLSSLPPLDMTYVNDEPNLLDAPDVFDETDVLNVTDVTDVDDASKALDVVNVLDGSDIFSVTNVPDVTDVTDDDDASYAIDVSDVLDESDIFTEIDDLDITDIFETINIDSVINVTNISDVKIVVVNVPDALNVSSSTSDIPQVTATREVLKVHHRVDIEYDANGPPALSSGPIPCPSIPPSKPPYPNQCGNTNLHGMSPYESLQAHVHEVEPMVVLYNDSTDDLNHDDDDLYDVSYEMDPFNIDTPVGNIQAVASKLSRYE
jgi:hypothetical protein